ncbi:hypothetical protein J6590_038182 [Homalodisca vitripennis]|nr:hypothetical protein J6590_038182 [Homalodisca vitripennis]
MFTTPGSAKEKLYLLLSDKLQWITIVPRHVRRLTGCGMNDNSRMRSNANSSDGPASRGARGQSTQSYHDDKTHCALRS